MDEKLIFAGVGGAVIGVVIGIVAGGGTPDLTEIRGAMAEAVAPASEESAALSGRVGGLEETLAGLSERLSGIETQLSEAPDPAEGLAPLQEEVSGLRSSMEEELATLRGALQEGLSAAADAQAGLQESLSGLGEGLGSLSTALSAMGPGGGAGGDAASGGGGDASAPAPEGSGSDAASSDDAASGEDGATEEAAAEPSPEPAPETGDELSPGMTAIFADGAVRVFVSRIDTETGTARLIMNGAPAVLPANAKRIVAGDGEPCLVRLDGVNESGAQISAMCGADIPEPEGVGMGETAMLGDGAARVFVSGVSADGLTARVAVNGISPQQVRVGESVPAGTEGCTVSVDDIDRGHVTFGYACGD
ncbi:hypothetical protein [Roseivivax isoporae]|uniref:Uncharacterized protein n=1 Tax=Roseivivax isoporae LMG 25204 TaxID=1449351 RepID=X7F915_9RHOB|nr:hypothetical protein [Roseivivax isoporae]ETX28549.1 hypothetical protein RISW2_06150 [Roseivivax isoporae LMG 25204]